MKYYPKGYHPLRSEIGQQLSDLAAANRRGDAAKVDDCLDMIGREDDRYAEAIARGRASVHARPAQRLRKAA